MEDRKVVANVGLTRVTGVLKKENPLTVWMKIEPIGMIEVLRDYFFTHQASEDFSFSAYRKMLKDYGLTRDGYIKRHKIRHRVAII